MNQIIIIDCLFVSLLFFFLFLTGIYAVVIPVVAEIRYSGPQITNWALHDSHLASVHGLSPLSPEWHEDPTEPPW